MSRFYEAPVAGRDNKFVITEEGAWFLPFEDKATAPTFAEILPELLEDLDGLDDDKFQDGRILVGYVAKESREVSIHNWPIDDNPDTETVKRRLKTVFPSARRFVGVDGNTHYL